MANEQQKLYTSVNRLAKFFGLYTARDLAGRIAMEQIQGIAGPSSATFDLPPPAQAVTDLVTAIVDTSEGAYTFIDLVDRINNLTTQNNSSPESSTGGEGSLQSRINEFLEMVGPEGKSLTGVETPVSINQVIIPTSETPFINSDPNNPDKDNSPHLSVIKVNNVRITPSQKNINAITIFLNGIPNLELASMVPFLEVQLLLPDSPVSSAGTLQNISLFRYLEGNAPVDVESNGTRSILALASKTRNTDHLEGQEPTEQNTAYTSTGMEIFTSPQSLTNGDMGSGDAFRVNPILDKFAPFLTLREFTIDVAPSTGMMSFKTGRLNFVLHDRSRLAEIANLIRPDLYSRTELLIEYGWAHPQTNSHEDGITNHYAELLNAMRCREKYGIINSSLSFEDNAVNITLDLAMKGGSDMASEVISTDETGAVSQVLRTIQTLSETVGAYRRTIFGTGQRGPSSVEVRGVQFLDTAEDARNNLILNGELRRQLGTFQRTLARRAGGNTGSEAAGRLSQALRELYESEEGGAVGQLRRTVQGSIQQKLRRVSDGVDPFIRSDHIQPGRTQTGSRLAPRTNARGRRDASSDTQNERDLVGVGPEVSLAKLLLLFVGEPLAATRKFDDIQFIFYPFNNKAGFARNINIGSFIVDTRYFYENYLRLRMESLSRSSNLNLNDFLQFITNTILDDHGAKSYGLFGMFRRVSQDGGGSTTEASVDAVELENRIQRLLTNVTPDATFGMPQVDFYLEALPQRINREGFVEEAGSLKTILRIHVFDRQMTAYETQGSLIAASREDEIRNISNVPPLEGGDPGVIRSATQEAAIILAAARSANLLEPIPDSDMFRITGGTAVLKEFLRRTMPYVIYGVLGTTVKHASFTSIQDPALSTVNMLRTFQQNQLEPRGEQPGGLPLQIIPMELSLTTFGCPLIDFAQQFFIDFQTGTSVDNIYAVTGLTHKISAGDFTTELKMASPTDAYGTYRALLERVNNASLALREQQPASNPTTT